MQPLIQFFPPLSEQRQFFLLGLLRAYPVTSVLDLGCGEGNLLGILCRPTISLPVSDDFDIRYGISPDASIRCAADNYPAWFLKRVAGLDTQDEVLKRAEREIDLTDNNSWFTPRPRWSDLSSQLWKGELQTYNPIFREFDAIVSSEVIEHLHEDVLDSYCPMVLGRYAPDIAIVTTPGYEFNQLFSRPESPSNNDSTNGRCWGLPDPTKRTSRVFRHNDHKFEWTRAEFRSWCEKNARTWGYAVEVSGVGTSLEPDLWGRDKDLIEDGVPLYATQTAVFRRYRERSEHRLLYEQQAIHELQRILGDRTTKHQLMVERVYEGNLDPGKGMPTTMSHETILELVKNALSEWIGCGEAEIADLWNIDAISIACRGSLEVLYNALIAGGIVAECHNSRDGRTSVEWEWVEPEKRARWARRVRWTYYVPRRQISGWDDATADERRVISITDKSQWQDSEKPGARGIDSWWD